MDLTAIQLAIPVFFLLIGIEMLVAHLVERDLYRLGDSVSNLSCGILQQVADVFLRSGLFAGYVWLFANERRFEIPAGTAWAWAACFLGTDFLYYWFHRWSHEVNAGWAAHVVHHQSEEMNLAVALRQGTFQQAFSWVFYLPLAVFGFPPAMFLAVSSLNTLYQFWIHTRLVGRLGPLEWVLNTPSHHRVHHGRNRKYIDRNHGGTLIVWDRLFGTFGHEQDEPVYGITRPLASFNPLWANVHYWIEMWTLARRARRPLDRLRVLWKRPGWRPDDLGGPVEPPEVDRTRHVRHDVPLAAGWKVYVLFHFVALNLGTVAFLYRSERLAPGVRVMAALAIAWSLASFGGLLDRRPWAVGLETARLVAFAVALVVFPLTPTSTAGGLALAAASAVFLRLWSEKPLPLPAEVR
jgi:sterol desaturase/sphingolipid hydroxylase (fatty acid hydroxylase superfamily)